MLKKLDRVFCGLLAFGAVGHLFGTFKFTELGTNLFVWCLSGVLAAVLITLVNVLRSSRPGDKAIAAIALTGNLGWIGVMVLFGLSIGNILDPRVLIHLLAAAGLTFFSVLALRS